ERASERQNQCENLFLMARKKIKADVNPSIFPNSSAVPHKRRKMNFSQMLPRPDICRKILVRRPPKFRPHLCEISPKALRAATGAKKPSAAAEGLMCDMAVKSWSAALRTPHG
ncbi:MAG: hypothetical protein Q4C72_10305, partial [Eubacteriales bacterium]|nr:hypothetical protein [Eubacteriales bacterium]